MSSTTCSSMFDPSADPKMFRRALGRYTTGITVITASSSDGLIGITANSFTSISLSPALVMWTPDKGSHRHDLFVAADSFAIHVLASDQKYICDAFVRSKEAFHDLTYHLNHAGVPIIENCLAVFECTQYTHHDAGDHTIILGEVHTAQQSEGDGLIFSNGAVQSLPIAPRAAQR